MIVRFTLQGDGKRIDEAIAAIEEGTKRSTGVRVSQSPLLGRHLDTLDLGAESEGRRDDQ
jgi:hypothetical protein